MSLIQPISTINSFCRFEFKEKGSAFIGQAYPVLEEPQIADILTTVRKKYYEATHHCYAYSLRGGSFKYSDDGEPSGTAGIRIYNAIEHFNLTDLLVISIRFYGGTKLGVGPLGKAYYNSAYNTLVSAPVISKYPYRRFFITAGFDMTSHIHRILSQYNAKIVNSAYSDNVNFECLALIDTVSEITHLITEISKGNAEIKTSEEVIYL